MGSECSVQDDYEIEEPVQSSNKDWILFDARRKQDDLKVTVFIHEKTKKNNRVNDDRVARATQHLKILKHPAILKHYWSCENSEEFCMVTEPVRPLESVLQYLDNVEVIAGLYNIIEALVFLHDMGGLSHNNVCLSSVFVSDNDWGWRLGSMECVCKHTELNNEFLARTRSQRDARSISPEEKGDQVNIHSKNFHSVDAYAFGMLVSDILDTRADMGDVSEKFGKKIQSLLLHKDPQMRPQLSSLLTDNFFRCSFLEIMNFLNHITIKTELEKENFFRVKCEVVLVGYMLMLRESSSLADRLTKIPAKVVATRMLPRLLSRFVLAELSAEKEFLPHLLTPYKAGDDTNYQLSGLTPILPDDLFKEHCVPILMTLWSVRDSHARMILLKYFGLYGTAFEKSVLENFILPQMLIGLRETNDRIVAATFSALSVMVPLLGASVVVGGERRKHFVEGRPKFNAWASVPAMSAIPVNQKKIRNSGPSNVCGVIDIENKVGPLTSKDTKRSTSSPEDRKHEKVQRRQEMEKRKEERKKEMERRRLEREKERLQRSLAKRLAEKSEDLDADSAFATSDQDDLKPWEEVDDTPSSPRSDVTSGRSSQATLDPSANYWSDEHSVNSEQDKWEMNDSEFTSFSTQNQRRGRNSPTQVDNSRRSRGNPLKLSGHNASSKTNRPSKRSENKADALGSEFEVPITPLHMKEHDYFVDMEPSVSFSRKDSPAVDSISRKFSSKLAMVEDTSQAESGWGEEWEDFDQ